MARKAYTWHGPKANKYGSSKVKCDGIVFDSAKEAQRYYALKTKELNGEIEDLQLQVKYVLIPSQYEIYGYTKNGTPVKGKLLERECSYYADFVYKDVKTNKTIVEDTKGMRTTDYIIKRKLMLYIHGIKIQEI